MEQEIAWILTENSMAVIVHEQQGQEVLPLDIYKISERNVQVCSQAAG